MSLFFLKCLLKRHDVDVVQLYLQWLKQLHTLGLIALTVSTVSPWLKSLVWQKHPSLVHCQHFYFIFFNYWSFWKCWTLIISHRTFSRGGTSFYREEYVTTSQKRQTIIRCADAFRSQCYETASQRWTLYTFLFCMSVVFCRIKFN